MNAATRERTILLALWVGVLGLSSILFSAWVGRTQPDNLHWVWIEGILLATVPGKFAVFGGLNPSSPLDPWGVALLGVAVDTFLAINLALCLEPFLKLPGIGTWLRNVHERAARSLSEYPRLKRMAFWGAAFFVALPLPGSGWMGGTFAGQLLGLSRTMGVAAIAVGTVLVTASFAALAQLLGQEAVVLLGSPWITVFGLLALLGVAWLLWRKFRGLLREA